MSISYNDLERLQEIKDSIKELVYEAQDLLPRGTIDYDRAKSYWLPHILMALDSQHDYLGGSMCTMQETIDDLEKEVGEYENDENDGQPDEAQEWYDFDPDC